MPVTSALELGRDASRRHAWSEAVEAFATASQAEPLPPEDLELQAEAAWWNADPEAAVAALERAFAGYEAAGRLLEAAGAAASLVYIQFRRLAFPVGSAWLARAERLLEDLPESGVHARMELFRTLLAFKQTHLQEAVEHADRAIALGRAHGNPEAQYNALSFKGMAEIARGNWQQGMAMIEEAAAAAVSGQLNINAASDIYCTTIAACRTLGDFPRAGQWANQAERWMQRESVGGYPGVCQVHRAELKMLHGSLAEAEQEARVACEQLERFQLLFDAGWGRYQLGEVKRRMGDLDAAAEAFERAYEYGHDGQPGLALLQLERGELDEAARSISRALAERAGPGSTPDRPGRAEMLPAQVEIAIARGDLDTARAASAELTEFATAFEFPIFEASAATARGEVLLAEGKSAEAVPVLARAWRLLQEVDLPFESAQARVVLAQALRAEGDEEAAVRDLRAAHAVFSRLGATREIRRVESLLGTDTTLAPRTSRGTVKRTFMFTDIVTSTDLVELIGDEAWNELLDWHDRELRKSIAQHHGEEVLQTGDGFFAAFEGAADGVDCAVDIQRRLARHRREHGFAPWVRVGLHAATATRKGATYAGRGVHVAARVGAAADREEVLVSAAVLDEAGAIRYTVSEPRVMTLKGVARPVEVRAVDWR
ncbi:MAG TPA: adenylate/guanylate cyclase domain-containing protein [Candidatus Limnocylindria bacterium]|nr:adenylate/guanylate cyclase domain-containing protein [Candidatus Limnocylindria bacterium]